WDTGRNARRAAHAVLLVPTFAVPKSHWFLGGNAMQLHRLSSTAALAALVCAPLALAQDAPIPKQLAGPPSEFSAMRPADPAAAAIHSKSALLQVELQAGKSGVGAAQLRLPVEGERLRMIVFSDGADWDATLSTPSGMATKSGGIRETTSFGIGEAHIPVQRFDLPASEAGEWTLALRGDATKRSATRGFVLMEGEASTQLV